MRRWRIGVHRSGGGYVHDVISTSAYHLRAAEGHSSLLPREVHLQYYEISKLNMYCLTYVNSPINFVGK